MAQMGKESLEGLPPGRREEEKHLPSEWVLGSNTTLAPDAQGKAWQTVAPGQSQPVSVWPMS